MAARNSTHTHRTEHDDAQPTDQTGQTGQTDHRSDRDPARQARAQLRRAKEAARYHQREYATLATGNGERAGPGIGDRQGEVA